MKIFKSKKNDQKIGQSQLDSAIRLFENTSIFKALLRIVFLAVTVSLASGLYVFADQVLMQKILPENNQYVTETLTAINWKAEYFTNLTSESLKQTYGTANAVINEITRLVNAGNSPITVICTAISLLGGLGSAIIYSKALGTKNEQEIRDIWKNSFYYCFVFSIVTTAIVIGLVYIIIPAEISNSLNQEIYKQSPQAAECIQRLQNQSREYAIGYSLILVGFNIFNNYVIYYVSLLNSEGKNSIPTIVVLISNGINILLDWVLLKYSGSGIYGSAIATIVSYVVAIIFFTIYLYIKNRQQDTFMIYKNLSFKNYKINWRIMLNITKVGIASFFRNASTAIFSIVLLSIYADITNPLTGKEATYYTSLMGAVTPIYNLFFSGMVGILRGSRTVISYNHGRGLTKNIYKAFWISTGMSFFYGTLFFVVAGPMFTSGDYANGGLLSLFNITPDNPKYWDAVMLLNINTSQLVIYAFLISGMLYFQSIAKPVQALITSIAYGLILGIPSLYIISAIAQNEHNIMIYQFSPVIISFISGLLIFGYTVWYLYFRKEKPKFKVIKKEYLRK
ncbi:MAG: hypothetical protein K2N92_01900 [Malacoplasma sp.]|nr:hypothetical protein [Malacoplasma sp.]MDE5841786.1 hypothetical protein [Malacoplasma sp.]MDE6429238.1 hypothetical protein [Malacoplasma sp.]MDE7112332.1 hypothetical protein [Malacoplasma sp.]